MSLMDWQAFPWKTTANLRVALIGLSQQECVEVHSQLASLASATAITFDKPADLLANWPNAPMDVLVLGPHMSGKEIHRMLGWSRRHWPRCLSVVISENSSIETTARQNAALFYLRPLHADQWQAVFAGALQCRQAV